MPQEQFDRKMEQNLKAPTVKTGIEESMCLAYEHPGLARSWVERLPNKQQFNENQERFVDADSIEGQLIVLRKAHQTYFHHSLSNVILQLELRQKERNNS